MQYRLGGILTLMRLRGPITPGFSVYASSMVGLVAGVNLSVSVLLFLEGLTLDGGLLLTTEQHFISIIIYTTSL